jgi:hypothetical protein
LAENRISSCRFGGDFLGNLPATDVESALQGVVYNPESIRECLSSFPISQYFDGVVADDLVAIMF